MQGSVLRHRIPRAESMRAAAGCSLAIGIVMTLLGGGILWPALAHHERGIVLIVGGAFAIVGVLMLYTGVHQLIASRLPETIFEIDDPTVHRGKARNAVVIQEGPVHLASLRANVVCNEFTFKIVHRYGKKSRETVMKQIWDTNVLEVGKIDMEAGERLQWPVVLDLPEDVEPTHKEGNRWIEWRVEVWGEVKGSADFMHPFEIEVL